MGSSGFHCKGPSSCPKSFFLLPVLERGAKPFPQTTGVLWNLGGSHFGGEERVTGTWGDTQTSPFPFPDLGLQKGESKPGGEFGNEREKETCQGLRTALPVGTKKII